MATFTISLKKVIEATGGTVDISTGVAVLTGGNIGLNHYPIFDEAYRPHLTGRIVDHYWNREIGQESIEMFQLAVRRRMNEVMPVMNKFYLSERMNFDPLSTIDIHTVTSSESTSHADTEGISSNVTDNDSKSRAVTSQTPQTMLSGSGDYATGASDAVGETKVTASGNESGSQDSTSSGDSESHTTGYQANPSDLIMAYRASLLNVDLMVIEALDDCFMQIWDNGDSYTNNNGGYFL